MKNIYRQDKSHSSSWVVRWYDPSGKRKSKAFSDKKFGGKQNAYEQAEAFLKITQAEILQGDYFDPHRNKISLNDFKHEVGLTKASHKESTKRALEDTWNSRVAPYPIADMSIGKIKPNDIDKHIRDLRKPNGEMYSRSALDKTVEVIRVLLNSAYEMDLIKKNPAKTNLAKKSLPKKIKAKKHYLNEFQVRAIELEIEKTHPIYSAMIPTIAYTGMRSGEIRALMWTDVDLEKGTISVNKSIDDDNDMKINYDDPKTERSVRTIDLSVRSTERLKRHKAKLPADCIFVFPNARGNQNGSEILCTNPIRARNFKRRVLKPALERLGYDESIALHDFRHTSVYLAVKQGKSLLGISKRLGHKNIGITADTYSILFEDVDQDIAKSYNELEELTETYSSVDHIKDVSPQEEVG